ncbi:MAG TPA: hypothetical protein VK858_02540, partial [Longimicrobiales bacterium]|nr:hypothetical protein [Longimicrobiales bacterium]
MLRALGLACACLVLGALACGTTDAPDTGATVGLDVDDARLASADQDREDWLTNGRTYREQRHSPLRQIDEASIARLGLAWFADMDTIR